LEHFPETFWGSAALRSSVTCVAAGVGGLVRSTTGAWIVLAAPLLNTAPRASSRHQLTVRAGLNGVATAATLRRAGRSRNPVGNQWVY
jgi:hypothetical protein